jgi:hypothetical protein
MAVRISKVAVHYATVCPYMEGVYPFIESFDKPLEILTCTTAFETITFLENFTGSISGRS